MIDLQNPSFLSSPHLHKVCVSVQEDYVVEHSRVKWFCGETVFSISVFLNLTIRKCSPSRRCGNPTQRLNAKLKVETEWRLQWNHLFSWVAKGLHKSRPSDRVSSCCSWSFVTFSLGWLQMFTVRFWETERANEWGIGMRPPYPASARKWSGAKTALFFHLE